jgi:energy-coupling factor transporter ATP-binding protein EcfA2
MDDLRAFWTPIVRAFDPYHPIVIGDPQHYYVERPDSPLDELMTKLMVNLNNPRKIILTGHRGSGKSSDLAKLAGDVADEVAAIWIDAASTFNMFDVGQAELLISLGAAINRDVPVPKEFEALKESLSTYIEERVGGTTAALTTEVLKKVGLDFRHTLFDRETRRKIEIPPILGGIVDKINLIVAAAQKKTKRPLLVIVDGLDRLDMEVARRIFVNNQWLAGAQCHIIFTVPISFYFSIHWQLARERQFVPFYLPNVKLFHRDSREMIPEGHTLMASLVHKRVRQIAPEVLTQEALTLLVQMSGGVIRELITLVESSCIKALLAEKRQIDLKTARQAVEGYQREKASSLPYAYYWEVMAQVYRTHQLPERREKGPDGAEFSVSDALLEGLYVLAFSDVETWYDVHPTMLPLLKRWEERLRL